MGLERLLCEAAGAPCGDEAKAAPRPRPGAVSFLHRFGSALNHHVHLHVCATDGVFMPAANGAGYDAPPAFLPVRPITQAHLAVLTERVRRRVIRWLRLAHLLDASAAATMLAWKNSGLCLDARPIVRPTPRRCTGFRSDACPSWPHADPALALLTLARRGIFQHDSSSSFGR